MRAPALRFERGRHPTINNHPRNIDRCNLKPSCCCCCWCRDWIEMPVDKLRGRSTRACQGHTRTGKHSVQGNMQVRAESNLNSPTPRVHAIRQLPSRRWSAVVSTSDYRNSCACRGMSSVLVDQVLIGAVYVVLSWPEVSGWKRPGIFSGYTVSERLEK